MTDDASPAAARRHVRPRSAGSLILLRETGGVTEVLLGRRSATARFMPGRLVFPGGAVQREDARTWLGEAPAAPAAHPALHPAARAALRETFEETGFVVGPPGGDDAPQPARRAPSPIEAAYVALRRIPDP